MFFTASLISSDRFPLSPMPKQKTNEKKKNQSLTKLQLNKDTAIPPLRGRRAAHQAAARRTAHGRESGRGGPHGGSAPTGSPDAAKAGDRGHSPPAALHLLAWPPHASRSWPLQAAASRAGRTSKCLKSPSPFPPKPRPEALEEAALTADGPKQHRPHCADGSWAYGAASTAPLLGTPPSGAAPRPPADSPKPNPAPPHPRNNLPKTPPAAAATAHPAYAARMRTVEALPDGCSSSGGACHWLSNITEGFRAPPARRGAAGGGGGGGGANGSNAARCIVGRKRRVTALLGRHLACVRTCSRFRGLLPFPAAKSGGKAEDEGPARAVLMRAEPPCTSLGRR